MTLSELSRLANVSISTASKAFSMSKEISDETRELVFSIARENGCFKKFFNAKFPKYMVAIICPEIKSYYYSNLCLQIQELLNACNCEVCISTVEFSLEKAKNSLEYYEKYSHVDAVVLIDTDVDESSEYIVPIIGINSNIKKYKVSIKLDYNKIMVQMLNHFLEQGITDIVYVGESLSTIKNALFKEISEKMLKNINGDFMFLSNERFEQGGYLAAQEIYRQRGGKFPKAVLCAYDNMAFGVIRFLNDNGINIPKDVKIVGMDNIITTDYYYPRLSSVDCLNTKVAEIVSKSLSDIFKQETKPIEYNIEPILVLRESSE